MNKQQEEKITRITLEKVRKNGIHGKTDWARVDSLTDEEIEDAVNNDPDAAPLVDKSFWDDADIFTPSEKVEVHMYLDKRVLDFFKRGGRGYQTRINAALCALVDSWQERHPS